ncbi:MAG: hypothetical protein JOZ01_08955 [Candidatus Eremiobacteraeota bacterium]|nr:hypothetical protein [Candidatus Eremiobacteraeota bacterium]
MPLQNRVTPYGDVVALPGRGLMMGNRGILHDDSRRIVRPFQVRRWIACRLEFRGRKRAVMQPHRYTELFFLDEAAAFSAGHRPCAECRREVYQRFRELWIACHGGSGKADDIDDRLHVERIARRTKRTYGTATDNLPNGTFVALDDRAWLVWGEALFAWSDSGYIERRSRPGGHVEVLTPPSIVRIFEAGYRPAIHPSHARPTLNRTPNR